MLSISGIIEAMVEYYHTRLNQKEKRPLNKKYSYFNVTPKFSKFTNSSKYILCKLKCFIAFLSLKHSQSQMEISSTISLYRFGANGLGFFTYRNFILNESVKENKVYFFLNCCF